jgi:hypothetical protein
MAGQPLSAPGGMMAGKTGAAADLPSEASP